MDMDLFWQEEFARLELEGRMERRAKLAEPALHIAQQANTAICGTCGGSGVVDSGGQEPWGQFINIPCPECRKQQ